MQTIGLPGGRAATYEVVGEGRPALMFPGGPGFAASYMRSDAELFADVLRSYLIDPHGSGGSTPPADPKDYSPEGHARFYDKVRRALGIERVIVLGHSFGATTALTYAALFPGAVERCIAVAAFGMGTEVDAVEGGEAAAEQTAAIDRHVGAPWFDEAKPVFDSWTERVLATDDPTEVEWMMATILPFYTAHPERPEVAAGLQKMKGHLKADLAAVKVWEGGLYQTIDLRPLLPKIVCPTLLVAGELDFICGPAQARSIAAVLPGAGVEVISDIGHVPSIEAHDAYRRIVRDFLD
ncbi:MAG: alpha/beta hydrolase [Actinobacteria bacterium]|nr:alpha/beta hydrolase [Actinomycetota bacterium]